MAYQVFQPCTDEVFESKKIINIDGTALYETGFSALLREIITRNDTAFLKQYIAAWDLRTSGVPVTKIQVHDLFYTAVANRSLDVLRVLLDVHRDNPTSLLIEEPCQTELVKFLLDSDPSLGTIYDRDPGGWTLIMSAAYSTGALAAADRAWDKAIPAPQPELMVLSLAITSSSYGMVKRLLEHGADVHERLRYFSNGPGFCNSGADVYNVTALYLGSWCWNINRVQAILDHGEHTREGEGSKGSDLICSRDGGGDPALEWLLLESMLGDTITSTFALLVPKDDKSATWLCSRVLYRLAYWPLNSEPLDLRLINLLLNYGALLDHIDENNKAALHIKARNCQQGAATCMLIKRGAKDRTRAQDEVVQTLVEVDGSTMDLPNRGGKCPRQLREETRQVWVEMETRRLR
ncbi:hypothetical protein BJY00DRAFT_301957 [Aspergillus carlsbadensis]|nr:hypothetical protein BJY00DRAFT_301957 [Aspergillus carlsbadensis]